MDIWEAIQQEAMWAIISPDDDAWMRKICRYYSRHFNTPLHLVSRLPIEEVALHVFEEMYSELDEDERAERIDWLLMTPEERLRHIEEPEKKAVDCDDKFLEKLNSEVASGETIQRPKEQKRELKATNSKPLPEGMKKLAGLVQKAKTRADKMAGTSLPSAKPSLKLEIPATLGELPEIKMSFGPDSNLGNSSWGDLDPLAIPKNKKK